ncbi:hypothetical protein BDF22DRAFT_618711 [Syncephalis plumigaleata]|nr:hypothetical protein BDF22DRAFT_618711 [Syncephalis plumigaleata]
MSVVNILNVQVHDAQTLFTTPFKLDIKFECISELKEDLEWKLIYVSSAQSEEHDQVLDSIMVGPVPVGINQFTFETDAPNLSMIPPAELLDVTVLLLTCSYRDKEFVRIGYYVNVGYLEEELKENPPAAPIVDKLYRNVLADKPKVTRYSIPW